jgi:hypothetical protein
MGPVRPPTGSYLDDPAAKLEKPFHGDALADALTKLEVIRFCEWISRGNTRQRALRSDLVILSLCRHLLPCKRPSAAWVGREHGVTRQRTSQIQTDFIRHFSDYIRLREQHLLPASVRNANSYNGEGEASHGTKS